MNEFIFILGKNPSLSIAEIISYLEARNAVFDIKDYSDDYILLAIDNLPENIIDDLGGTIKIAKLIFSTQNNSKVLSEFEYKGDLNSLFEKMPKKLIFGVSSYISRKEHVNFSDLVKRKLREKGIDAGYMHLPTDRCSMTNVEVIKKRLIEDSLELIICSGKQFYIGKTIYVHNPFEFQKRDIGRPVQRAMYSIPPRLCKIMINLSKSKEGTILDPFCGIGSILQEAALMKYKIIGMDINGEAIDGCLKNLTWLEKNYKIKLDKKIYIGDATKVSQKVSEKVDAVVTEPYLGPPLIKKPNYAEAEIIVKELENMFKLSLNEMIKILKPDGRIVIITPAFITENGIIQIDLENINDRIRIIDPLKNYKIEHDFPFLDHEERHKTIRQINIIKIV